MTRKCSEDFHDDFSYEIYIDDLYATTISQQASMKTLLATITKLKQALILAKEHLEYCNYGNSWERDRAHVDKLPTVIEAALKF